MGPWFLLLLLTAAAFPAAADPAAEFVLGGEYLATLGNDGYRASPDACLLVLVDPAASDVAAAADQPLMVIASNATSLGSIKSKHTCGLAFFPSAMSPASAPAVERLFAGLADKRAAASGEVSLPGLERLQAKGFHVTALRQAQRPGHLMTSLLCPEGGSRPGFGSNSWSPQGGFLKAPAKCPHQLRGKHVSVSFIGLPPYLVYGPGSGADGVTGMDPDLLGVVARHLGFTYRLVKEPYWAKRDPATGAWSGTIGSVKNGASALGLGVHMVGVYQRQVDYAATLHLYDVRLCVVKPRPLPALTNLVRPFPAGTWAALAGGLAVGCAAQVALTRFVAGARRSPDGDLAKEVVKIVGSQFSQSPRFDFARLPRWTNTFLLSWFYYAFFVVSFYECNLRAHLMSTSYEPPVDNEQDLLDQGKMLYLPTGTHYPDLFKHSPYPTQRELYATMEKEGNFYRQVDGLVEEEMEKRIVKEGNSVIWTTNTARASFPRTEARHGWQPFRLSERVVFLTYSGWVTAKGLRWREDITRLTARLAETGVKDWLLRRYIKPKFFREVEDAAPGHDPFGVEHVFSAIVLLVAGLAAAGAAAAAEAACSRPRGASSKGRKQGNWKLDRKFI